MRPTLRVCSTVSKLAKVLSENSYDCLELPNVLKLLDWLLCIPLSNAGECLDDADLHTIDIDELGSLLVGATSSSNTTSFTYKLGTGNTTDVDDVTISVNGVSASALGVNGGSVSTAALADTASTAVTAAIDTLNTARSGVGAAQNRLEFASDNLATTIENTEAARSNLLDLDVAAEMTSFTSKQILVQVGVAMLAQANQLPQNLMQLFR